MSSDLERIATLASRGWMSPNQFAGLIGVSYYQVMTMIQKNQVQAVPVGQHYRIYKEEIERFQKEGNAPELPAGSGPSDPEEI